MKKQKCLNFGQKMPVFSIFDQKPLICVFSGWNFRKLLPCLKSAPSNFYKCEFGTKNALFKYFSPKIPNFGILGKKVKKSHCHIWNQHLEITVIGKFVEETKTSKYQTKNVWLRYFGAWTWKQHCHVWNQHPWICLIA